MSKLNVVLLRKKLNKFSGEENLFVPMNYTHWLCLGHFDDMYVYSLNIESNFLTQIKDNKNKAFANSDEHNYYHPLHLIPMDSNSTFINDDKYNFIAIIRIHFIDSTEFETQLDDFKKKLHNTFTDNGINLEYQIYYATELSDVVVDVRANNLSLLISKVLGLHLSDDNQATNTDNTIGKTYTYFGINYKYLCSNAETEDNDKIKLFTMRFSGNNTKIAKEQIKLIEKEVNKCHGASIDKYCINGIDDIMLICKSCPTFAIVSFFRKLLFDNQYCKFRKSESSSRLGISFEVDEFINTSPNNKLTESIMCSELYNLCNGIYEHITSTNLADRFGWYHTISEIANSLVRMAKTPIMDEVVYLVAPAVHAFLRNTINLLKKDDTAFNYNIPYDYVESCSYYLEQLMRIEGQLSHNPEIRPVIYDIPVFMLEYTIAFLYEVTELLSCCDDVSENKRTTFLLVPKPCDCVSACELFCSRKVEYGLVHITIPEEILYTPEKLLRILCHEVSHYAGEKHRCRTERKQAYAHAAAALLAKCIFGSNDEIFISMFKRLFTKSMQNLLSPTIREMHEAIMCVAKDVLLVENSMDNVLDMYNNYARDKITMPKRICCQSDENMEVLLTCVFSDQLLDMDILFREVYADICMIHILEIDTLTYIDSLLESIELNNSNDSYTYEMFALRIYVTLTTLEKDLKVNQSVKCDKTYPVIKKLINLISKSIEERQENVSELAIPMNSIYALLSYARMCYKKLKETSFDEEKLNVIREMYKIFVDNNSSFEDILNSIHKCRKNILSNYTSSNIV